MLSADEQKVRQVFRPADILLPETDMQKWSVIACDQHTSEPEYWERVSSFVGDAPSTLRMTLPEHFYYCENLSEHVKATQSAIHSYLNGSVFKTVPKSFVYVERTLFAGRTRRGLVGEIDLESYEHSDKNGALIRATEGIVDEKMPPRIALRDGAELELSHVLVLLDDPGRTLIEPLSVMKDSMERLYDFELMEDGGHIKGFKVGPAGEKLIYGALSALCNPENFAERYGFKDKPVLLFATGDGNHSLATAKACWDKMKTSLTAEERENHPARYSLVELINIHDESLDFEPINRVLFNCDPEHVIKSLLEFYPGSALGVHEGHQVSIAYGDTAEVLTINKDAAAVAIGALGKFLDTYLKDNPGRVDYVHGDDVVVKLSRRDSTLGFVLPAIDKHSFFASIIQDGSFPRKTFSMGLAHDKRYYLECRKI